MIYANDISQLWSFSDVFCALAFLWGTTLPNRSKIMRLQYVFPIEFTTTVHCANNYQWLLLWFWTAFGQSTSFKKPIAIQIFKSNRTQYVTVASQYFYYSISLSAHHLMNLHHFEYICTHTQSINNIYVK